MARTAWHLNRGFPLCTSSSLRSFCLHKTISHSSYESKSVFVYACVYVLSLHKHRIVTAIIYIKSVIISFTLGLHMIWRCESMSPLNNFKVNTYLQFILFIQYQSNLGNKVINCLDIWSYETIPKHYHPVVLCCGVSKLSSCGILAKR